MTVGVPDSASKVLTCGDDTSVRHTDSSRLLTGGKPASSPQK